MLDDNKCAYFILKIFPPPHTLNWVGAEGGGSIFGKFQGGA